MSTIKSKNEITEEDIKFQHTTLTIVFKWDKNKIDMEVRITDGMINIRGNKVSRAEAKKSDYILYLNLQKPIAIVKVKSNKYGISCRLQ